MVEQKNTQIGLTSRQRMIEPTGPAKPAAGVTATRPATRPDARPSIDALLRVTHSTIAQEKPAAAVARSVLIMARPA